MCYNIINTSYRVANKKEVNMLQYKEDPIYEGLVTGTILFIIGFIILLIVIGGIVALIDKF